MINGLLLAWILSLFNFDIVFVEGVQTFVDFKVITAHYYLLFAILGVLQRFIEIIFSKGGDEDEE